MYLKYGTYQHDSREVGLTIQRRSLVSESGVHYGTRETWNVIGLLQADNQTLLTAKIDALMTAYRYDGSNIGLYLDSGIATSHKILNSDTMGGIRVVQEPSFPEDGVRTAEYSTFRSYTIILEADLPIGSANVILSWTESLDMTGRGGPLRLFLPVLTGPWQEQMTTDASTYTVVQSGAAVGLRTWPVPATPLWPSAEHQERSRVRHRTPRFRNSVGWEYPVTWSYTFEATGGLTGTPTPI